MPTAYIHLKYWQGPDLGIGASASYYFQAWGLQSRSRQHGLGERYVRSALPLSPETCWKTLVGAEQSPETWQSLKERAKDKKETFQDL